MGRGSVGVLAGLLVGAIDLGIAKLFALDVTIRGHDVLYGVMAFFALSYAVMGFAFGRLFDARVRIAEQLDELARGERALVQQEKLAAIGRLAAGVAHEVRNPLGVIRSSAALVKDDFPAGHESARACEFIIEETDRLNQLISTLLTFAKPAEIKREATSIGAVVERAAKLARRPVELELDPSLEVELDPDLMTQVVLGLVVNAAEAEAPRIVVRARTATRGLELEVADSGPGVAPADRDKIFEPFFTTKATGTGLGLPMARKIVEAHGGTLALEGAGCGDGGRGACFRMTLPGRPT